MIDTFLSDDQTDNDKRLKLIKQAAIASVSQDPEIWSEVYKIEEYTQIIEDLQNDELTSEILDERLMPVSELIGEDLLEDFKTHLFIGDDTYVRNTLGKLLEISHTPDFLWNQVLLREDFPSELYHSFSELSTLVELSYLARRIEGEPAAIKARYLLPYLEKGISGSVLREMAEGRFSLPDDLLVQQVETFIDFSKEHTDVQDKGSAGVGKMRKVISSILATAALTLPIAPVFTNVLAESRVSHSPIEQAQRPTGNTEQLIPAAENSPVNPPDINPSQLTPENNSPDELKNGQQTVLWEITGHDIHGYYRENTAEEFNYNSWLINEQILSQQPVQTDNNDITLSGKKTIDGSEINLPTKGNYAITRGSIKVKGSVGGYSLSQTTAGSYVLSFDQGDIGKDVSISYSLGKIVGSVIVEPTEKELVDMGTKAFSIEDIPKSKYKSFMQHLSKSNESQAKKARALEKYIQNHFLYSLDKSVSDDYLNQPDTVSYFQRMFEIRRGDCDVVNTAFIMSLRAIGIPARLIIGDAHTGGFINNNSNKITEAENHAWTEAYVDGGFIELDGTPFKLDKYTQEALKGKTNPDSSFESQRIKAEEDKYNQENSELYSLKQLLADNEFVQLLLGITGISTAALAGSIFLRRHNNKAIDRLLVKLKDRTESYVGKDRRDIVEELIYDQRKAIYALDLDSENRIFALVPPGGVISLANDIIRSRKIKRLPFSGELPEITQVEQPNKTEYLTKILGHNYTEEEVKDYIEREAYFATKRDLSNQRYSLRLDMFSQAVFGYNFDRHVKRYLEKIPRPQTRQEWEETTSCVTKELYQKMVALQHQRRKGNRTVRPNMDRYPLN